MRTLLLGSDFVYKPNGDLVPLEINTNVGMESYYLESDNEIFNLTELSNFITSNNFVKVTYIGNLLLFNEKLNDLCINLSLQYEFIRVFSGNLTVPFVEDTPDHLIIRSAYDTTAIVDDVYCKNKVNFLKIIKNQSYGSEFAYMDEMGNLVNYITTIIDNGNNPNFILKSVLPFYDKKIYPKLYKVTNQEELQTILANVNNDYFLMPYYYNSNKLYNNQINVLRTFNLLFPPNLESLYIGSYKKFTDRKNEDESVFNINTFELDYIYRNKYITGNKEFLAPKLLDTDRVELADGTFKTALDLQVGDMVKTINIYNPYNVDLNDDLEDFLITYEEFISGTTYSSNKVIAKNRVDRLSYCSEILFTDGTNWSDTINSSYLIYRNNEIRFERIGELNSGDQIVLIDTTNNALKTVLKTVNTIQETKIIFSGWEISVEERHVFLTQTDNDTDNESYAAIEHNVGCSGLKPCTAKKCGSKSSCITYGKTCECV